MHILLRSAALAVIALSFAPATALAQSEYLTVSGGMDQALDDGVALFGIEYRGPDLYHGLLPIVGVEANVDGGVYGYAGLNWDLEVTPNWLIVPSFAVGGYHQGDDSYDLGGALNFRSRIEVDYRFQNQHRLGLSFSHISNASIYDHNPGTEALMLNYSLPMQVFGD